MKDETLKLNGAAFETLVNETLLAVARVLEDAPDSPLVREQRARLRSYEQIVRGWVTIPSTDAQREATFELVVELHAKVNEAKRVAARKSSGRF
jgi:hypothetical protein